MTSVLDQCPNLTIMEASVHGVRVKNGKAFGAILGDGSEVASRAVVITPGTALGGRIHVGSRCERGGGNGQDAVDELATSLRNIGFRMGRLKTGTPPRILKDSINYSLIDELPGECPPPLFSWEGRRQYGLFHVEHWNWIKPDRPSLFHVEHIASSVEPWPIGAVNLPCFMTHTTELTHSIIRGGLSRSALYGGYIKGTGVRYCPSVEDKIVKFPEKSQHHVFIEPEGLDSDLVYPNGISNSLPEDVQVDLVHSIPGMEKAQLAKIGFAIEYDFVDPTQLSHSLETKTVENLYLAGQINGTTGYEEAAAQGFMAGVNAARKAQGKPQIVLSRQEAYIGVLIDDLVTNGTNEPYRMFTSRAERRLILRQDNARFRMLSFAKDIGIVSAEFVRETEQFTEQINFEMERLQNSRHRGQPLLQILRQPDIRYADLPSINSTLPDEVMRQLEILAKYEGYIRREQEDAVRAKQLEGLAIPSDFDYWSVKTLRHETKEKLSRIRPTSIGQAGRVSGITPADLAILSTIVSAVRRTGTN